MTRVYAAVVGVCAALLCACGSGAQAAPKPAAFAPGPAPSWQAPLDRDHALVGRIFDAASGAYVGEQALVQRMLGPRFVLIGEQHDNPDHHLLQARLLRALLAGGRRPTVVFEMLDQEQQPVIDRALAAHVDVDAFGGAVDWAHSGWPPWSLYRPLFAEVLDAGLPIIAAGLDRRAAMRMAGQDLTEFDPTLAHALEAVGPLAPEQQAALREEMQQAHCGKISATEMLDAMALIQRARDARLALGLQRAGADGAVLIAGAGHVRNDRGVPAYLARAGTGAVLSIALLEVQHGVLQPADYIAQLETAVPPYDLLWFTPRASDADHCAEVTPHPAPAQP